MGATLCRIADPYSRVKRLLSATIDRVTSSELLPVNVSNDFCDRLLKPQRNVIQPFLDQVVEVTRRPDEEGYDALDPGPRECEAQGRVRVEAREVHNNGRQKPRQIGGPSMVVLQPLNFT
jgi:hypothetical protein